ncbi:MAG: bile acid:sodium symporter [Cobetia sp.]|jgi:BASS family bile acid:Na+ symporter|uniref:Bile acid:sodium symporter family protein n=1 Tax=Cobetia amphilecti TaxID=1055104 RepID=A0AAP4TZ43_9GAMM|nr:MULTISPECIES: bile acid:sodium symporter family protein [Cobetia]AVV34593.1 bile acid:sodium symporter family protein [Halomonas sp. SF2003]MBR9755790.1 bile acid:sodium symporter family protein [Gammaproteobacteria bacterium]TCJ27095.1 bile acid:sodium symporter family protein [Halomonas sp. GDM18]UTV86042.1 bile acid:sodium symporter family protein [Cobetia litoralis]KGA02201.1 bile acid:sodium symporter [Cobetia amphilecti]|tara:strand:+ start:17306 stop:18250 length:945 start_codon:yes stop_codon:yes gene_type:complete
MFETLNRFFPLWALVFAGIAVVAPTPFVALKDTIQPLLALIMFAMGLTLSRDDFIRVARRPGPIALGLLLQYSVMPLAAFLIARLLGLDPALTVGMVLVGATAGGTSSNVMTWLAGGHVALSVSMTMASTLLSIVMTPLLTWWLLGTDINVPVSGMLLSIAKLVVAPIVLGVVVHHFARDLIREWESALASLAMLAIVLIIAIVVSLNVGRLATLGPLVALAVVAHNAIGLSAGYGLSRLFGLDERTSRTIAIEVGMQNSGLAASLASQFFSATAALPGAIFSIWHNVSGSLLAGYWKRRPPKFVTGSKHRYEV